MNQQVNNHHNESPLETLNQLFDHTIFEQEGGPQQEYEPYYEDHSEGNLNYDHHDVVYAGVRDEGTSEVVLYEGGEGQIEEYEGDETHQFVFYAACVDVNYSDHG